MTIEFWWRQIFEILMIHKPSRESLDVSQKIWAWSVQPFWRLLDTNRQTDRQTDKPNLYIDRYRNFIKFKEFVIIYYFFIMLIDFNTFQNPIENGFFKGLLNQFKYPLNFLLMALTWYSCFSFWKSTISKCTFFKSTACSFMQPGQRRKW